VSHRRRKMYVGHACLSVSMSICLWLHAYTTAQTQM